MQKYNNLLNNKDLCIKNNMNISDFNKIVAAKTAELEKLVRRQMPVLVGRMAKTHFQENFRKGGFVNGGLNPWPKSKRQNGTGTKASYKTLLSSRNHLFSSIQYIPSDGSVTIENRVPYASVHNDGYSGVQYVKPHKKNRLDAMSIAGRQRVRVGGRNIASGTRRMVIPKRQFIGESKELTDKIEKKLELEITKIIKS